MSKCSCGVRRRKKTDEIHKKTEGRSLFLGKRNGLSREKKQQNISDNLEKMNYEEKDYTRGEKEGDKITDPKQMNKEPEIFCIQSKS